MATNLVMLPIGIFVGLSVSGWEGQHGANKITRQKLQRVYVESTNNQRFALNSLEAASAADSHAVTHVPMLLDGAKEALADDNLSNVIPSELHLLLQAYVRTGVILNVTLELQREFFQGLQYVVPKAQTPELAELRRTIATNSASLYLGGAMRLSWDPGRKHHVCQWCDQQIIRGEGHYRVRGQWQGRQQDWRIHAECYAASEREPHGDEGFVPHSHARGRALGENH